MDPRVPWVAVPGRQGFNSAHTNLPNQLKYSRTGSVRLADGIEARLIELEARLRGASAADREAVFNGLNDLRANGGIAGIPALVGVPATQDLAVDQLFEERALWMWLTGHRLGDLRRLIRQYGRGAETVFPTGAMRAPLVGNYGTDVNLIIPAPERNNPKFGGCLNRGA